ncbi:MAG: ABC transporter ATP-binding protein [Lachnospiraceae bacterium]|nr:ABC transporter ATP-binding protein [Lachnospiraceae bacterium]
MEEKLLEIKNLKVQFVTERATTSALNGVNLTIHKGESLGLVGESGAGKTTTALATLKLLPRAGKMLDGQLYFKGKNIYEMSKKELLDMRGHRISMIFQNPLTSLNPVFTVGEQIGMVLRQHKGLNKKQADEETKRLLETVGIAGYRLNDYPNQFSGGMRQRVGIAAGIACNPELLIADEPTTALDVTIQAQILELMKRLQKEYSTSLLMITHNLGIISELCEKVAVMYAGRIIEYGTVREVFSSPAHPYTKGLLGSLPKLEGPRERLTAIPGTVANPQNLPDGCRFHPRCEHCQEKCCSEQPEMIMLTENHYVECFRGGEIYAGQ